MIEIKYLRPELLEAIARNTLKKYDESLVKITITSYQKRSLSFIKTGRSLSIRVEKFFSNSK